MQTEIEAKFLNVDHAAVRAKLRELGATLEQPMRVMRRAMFDFPDNRLKSHNNGRLRIRDEQNKVTLTYKSRSYTKYQHEVETTVSSYEDMSRVLEAIGLEPYSRQETKRETWQYRDTEVVLDEWPWINAFIEIEGSSEAAIRRVAEELGFDWQAAAFGSVDTIYRRQYPGMKAGESIGDVAEVRFDAPLPKFLQERLPQ